MNRYIRLSFKYKRTDRKHPSNRINMMIRRVFQLFSIVLENFWLFIRRVGWKLNYMNRLKKKQNSHNDNENICSLKTILFPCKFSSFHSIFMINQVHLQTGITLCACLFSLQLLNEWFKYSFILCCDSSQLLLDLFFLLVDIIFKRISCD